ncbi:MAG: galactose mutarotase [Bacteroidales bacterium]|nr:galactose mutarotase [Bacteroidales bacterium]
MKRVFNIIAGAAIAALCVSACTAGPAMTLSGLDPKDFEGGCNGKATALYTLTNANGMEVCVTNFGGRLVSVMVPDRDGKMTDVILGFDNINDYMTKPSDFGASIGRYANRIGGAAFELDGQTVTLDRNDGDNCLHGGAAGWQYQVYDAELIEPQTLKLTMVDPDGHMGFPGTVTAVVTYTLTDDNAIDISYSGTTDKPTVLSMTNHAYFNLSGNHAAEGTDQILYVNADKFTPADEKLIPTGEMRPVEGTPFDFRTPKAIGQDINADYDQLVLGNGYDHNWVLNTGGDISKLALSVYSPATGILLEEYTDQPGVQVYTGNFLTGEVAGKHGVKYPKRASVCIETQLFPDSPNKPEWPSATLRPGETYTHRCIYKFSVAE